MIPRCRRSATIARLITGVGASIALALPVTTESIPAESYLDEDLVTDSASPATAQQARAPRESGTFASSGVDLLGHLALNDFTIFSGACTDIWGYVSPSGREYAILGFDNKTAFVEITLPTDPVIVAEIPRFHNSIWSDMAIYQTVCYVVGDGQGGQGMQIIDLAAIDDGVVTPVGSYTGSGLTSAHNVWVNPESGYAYLTGADGATPNGGLFILDLEPDPTSPGFAGVWDLTYVHDVEVVTYDDGPFAGKEVAFAAGQNVGRLYVVDVTDKRNITVMSSDDYPTPSITHQSSLTADRRYLLLDDEGDELNLPSVSTTTTYVYDVQDLNAVQYVGSFTNGNSSSDHNQLVRGNYTYQANYRSGLRIYDVSGLPDLGSVEEVGWLDTFPGGDNAGYQGAWGVFVDYPSGLVVVSDIQSGLFVVSPVVTAPTVFTDVTAPPLGDTGAGQGVAWADIDADGDPDLYVTNDGSPNRLYRNDAGTFVDVTAPPLDDAGAGRAAVWADYDGDLDLDLFLTQDLEANRLFRNDGGTFVDVSTDAIGGGGRSRGAAWADYDVDGDLDLYVTNVDIGNLLVRNDGSALVDVATEAGVTDAAGAQAVAWADYDVDGDPDLYVTNIDAPNRLYRNESDGTFVDVASALGVALGSTAAGMGAAWGDYDGDGDPDLYLSAFGQPNHLFRNDDGIGFTEVTITANAGTGSHTTTSVAWTDYDLDGWLDLCMTENGGEIRLFRNTGNGWFTDQTGENFPNLVGPASLAHADADGDGDPDIYTTDEDAANRLYENEAAGDHHWLQLALQSQTLNTRSVGARVRVVADGHSQTREVAAGSGYLTQNADVLIFGLGAAETVDSLTIRWTNGVVFDTTAVAADQRLTIIERGSTPTQDHTPADGPPIGAPVVHRLYPAAPNPFNPTTRIHYDLASDVRVRLSIFDVAGRRVRRLVDQVQVAGRYQVAWDGRDAAGQRVGSGAYFYRLEAGAFGETRRVTLVK